MPRRRGSTGRKAGQLSFLEDRAPYGQPNEEEESDQLLSTPDEIKRAVERNAIDRGTLFIGVIVELDIEGLLRQIEDLANTADKEIIRESADILGIDVRALDLLDNADPPFAYTYYFCTPDTLINHPKLIFYYRNIAMLSAKVMRGIGLDTAIYESGGIPTRERAAELAAYLNKIVSGLIIDMGVTRLRHIEMLMTNLGDALGGSSRNEVGRVAMVQVMRSLIKYLHQRDYLESINYTTRESLVPGAADRGESVLLLEPNIDIDAKLNQIESDYVKYQGLRLKNGVVLLIDSDIKWRDSMNREYSPSADMHSAREATGTEADMIWGAEVKGGADPAGSDEHWKTASRALNRILEAAEKTGHDKPPLSFIGTTIVGQVALEISAWLDRGDLRSAYNLTKMIEQPLEMQRFLDDMMEFLGYGRQSSK
jgi:hypothetical protein